MPPGTPSSPLEPPASAPSDPTTPGTRPAPTALNAAVTTVVAGTPAGMLLVWLLETYGTAHGQPLKLDSTTASVIGSIGGAAIGYITQVVVALFQAFINRLAEPPASK